MFIQAGKNFINQPETSLNKLAGYLAHRLPFSTGRGISRTEGSQARQRPANITVAHVQGQLPVAILHLHGPLNAGSYLDLIAKAREIYQAGTPYLILNMSNIPSVGLSGILALHSIAVLLRGEEPLDPQGGWNTLRATANELQSAGLQKQFKLFNPKPQVWEALEHTGLVGFLEIHTDLDAAISSFQAGRWH